MKECIAVPVGQPGRPNKSQVVKANGFLFFSAQRGVDPSTYQVTSHNTAAQSRQLLENLTDVLGALGGSLNDVVKTGRYLEEHRGPAGHQRGVERMFWRDAAQPVRRPSRGYLRWHRSHQHLGGRHRYSPRCPNLTSP